MSEIKVNTVEVLSVEPSPAFGWAPYVKARYVGAGAWEATSDPLPPNGGIVKYGLSVNKVWGTFAASRHPLTAWTVDPSEFHWPDFSSFRARPYDWRVDK